MLTDEFLVVGIGASAGGIHACESFFKHVAPDSGAAYVVILHLSPDHESRLAEVLQRSAAIPVMQVTERVRVVPDQVYVIPPNQSLSMDDGFLTVSPIVRVEDRRAPVDTFFRTLGTSRRSRAVCIVLSGTGADGSMGLKRVKEHGGICLAQHPAEAEFADMPTNAIATGLVDAVISSTEMPARIVAYRTTVDRIHLPADATVPGGDDDGPLREIFAQLRVRTGHDFSNYKRGTVLRRLARRMGVHQVPSLADYAAIVRDHPGETDALLKDLLISVTNFFRDRDAWEALERDVIPAILQRKAGTEQPVRVWVAGCATGEEAYSVAMLLEERLEDIGGSTAIQVFASDLDARAIGIAREGVYTLNDAADVSPGRLRRFFVQEGERYRVRKDVREKVLFARHNVLKDPPFSHVDLVCCRNLLIYLNRTAQQRFFEVAHFGLNPEGFLFLGSSESIDGAANLFDEVDKGWRIFKSRAGVPRRPVPMPEPVTRLLLPTRGPQHAPPDETPAAVASPVHIHQRMLEDYAPPSLVVNAEHEIVHLTAGAARFLQFSEGVPSTNLLSAIRPELRGELRTALLQAAFQQQGVRARGLVLTGADGAPLNLDLLVRPARLSLELGGNYFLVLFEEVSEAAAPDSLHRIAPVSESSAIVQLENELTALKGQLRLTLERHETQAEELKASNEEQQAVNEELRSSAEELETSREELQSLNEELNTVNQELRVKIDEQTRASDHIHNLINSTEIATIFVDRALRVQLFTPQARELFNLIPADRNRPLNDIHTELTGVSVGDDVEQVLRHLQLIEREVQTRDGRWWGMRVLPYRTSDDRIDGVVMTFVDVTERKKSHGTLMLTEARLRTVLQSVTQHAIVTMTRDGTIEDWNIGAEMMFGFTRDEAVGQPAAIIFTPEDRAAGIPEKEMASACAEGRAIDERWHLRKDGIPRYVSGVLSPVGNPIGGFVKITQDLTDRKRWEDELTELNASLETRVAERTREVAEANETLQRELIDRRAVEERVRLLLSRLLSVQEEERRRIARDLHDDLGQQMTALHLKLQTLAQTVGDDSRSAQINDIQGFVKQLDQNLDLFTWELRPAALYHLGLPSALRDYVEIWARNYEIAAEFDAANMPTGRFTPDVETNLFRIAQEALNNVQKHSGATSVDVRLRRRDTTLVLTIEDNGLGFDPGADPSGTGIGLLGMRERAFLLNGTVEIDSKAGDGTTVIVTVPGVLVRNETPDKTRTGDGARYSGSGT